MTIRLYDKDVDQLTFTAAVLSCEEKDGAFFVVLDRTAFYPEGGGQMADRGTLGGVAVLDVKEKDGVITHKLSAALAVGSEVTGEVDFLHRFDMMQQHSGEHILSGTICAMKNCDNVGFHIGEEDVRLDFNAVLTEEELREAERRANEAIWRNVPVEAWVPDKETLAQIDYRSKKALTGDIRIVRIEGFDTCACCGTHVHTAGQIGQIRIVDAIHYKGGMRIMIRCGMRALAYGAALQAEGKHISHLLSAKPLEIAAAVDRVAAERDSLRARNETLAMQCFRAEARSVDQDEIRVILGDMLEPGQLRKAAGLLAEGAKVAAILLPREGGFSYAVSSSVTDIRPAAKLLNERFGGKGGGPKDMIQGVLGSCTVEAVRETIKEALA